MTIGIIGYGRFGRLAARFISKRAHVLVFDKSLRSQRFPSKQIAGGTLREVASQSIVILAVPVSALKQTLYSIVPFLRPSALIVDVCAVKVKPIEWMKKILPDNVNILGAHPLFGPDSASVTLRGHRIALCPIRISEKKYRGVVRELKGTGLAIRKMTPDDHDRMIAESLFLTQFIGRTVSNARFGHHAFSTNSYVELMKIVRVADNDTRELFRDMFRYNPYARRVLKQVMLAEARVLNDLSVYRR